MNQKTISFWVFILLTTLSANATVFEISDNLHTPAINQTEIAALSSGKAILHTTSKQEVVAEIEQDFLPLLLDDNLLFFTGFYNCKQDLFFSKHNKKGVGKDTTVHKYYTKLLLFPFHSYW